jgi:uncharacterized membrane protein YjgN (DUF898 family)
MQPGRRRDVLAGIICIVAGLGAVAEASRYTIGSLSRLGPGFYPAVLGALLALMGIMILAAALAFAPVPDEIDQALAGRPDWRGWVCIIGGVVLFILFAWLAGLAPAIFACVFTAALGDRTASVRGSIVLALGMTVFGTVLFGYLLGINIPLWQWPWAE